jgi:hypothetical protein
MKEASRVGLDGVYIEPVIISFEQVGVIPEYAPIKDSEELEIIGYTVCEKVPQGFYMPKWDFTTEQWKEVLTQEEIDVIRNVIQPETIEAKALRLELDLKETKKKLILAEEVSAATADVQQQLIDLLVELGVL